MRIGIDCRTMLNPEAGERAGVGHYTTYLVQHIVRQNKRDQFVLFFDHRMPRNLMIQELTQRPNVEMIRFPFSEYKRYVPLGYSHVFVAQILRQQNLDLFHSPAYAIPLQYNQPSVVTIHDLAIYLHPSWFPPKQQFSTKVLVPSSIKRASKIIAVSKATEKMVKEIFHVPKKKVQVIYEGFAKEQRLNKEKRERVRNKFGINERYIFFVGTVEPRKNLVHLVKAFDHFMNENYKRHRDIQLVIAGGKGWKHQPVFTAIARAKWSSNIRVIGYITHEEKIALLEPALFFAFPSFWEGFGLPVLEAASLGVPVLTSRVSSLPEVAGDGALYVHPDSVRSIQQGMTTLVRNAAKRRSLSKKGKKHAKQFSWAHCAKETYDLYCEVVQAHQHNFEAKAKTTKRWSSRRATTGSQESKKQ